MIDRETVQKIIDTADIVEVVSDFVSLQKRGANYIGLCPFHNERTPSFSVSRAKGICKCFSCGKGGSPVNFVMEHEQVDYWDALRYLARKYHIEVREHEMTDAERVEHNTRQSMLAVNDFAMQHFEKNLSETDDGRDIGLSYFRERGINDWAIARFHLGYALEKSDALYSAAMAAGYAEQPLLDTGVCVRNDRGRVYDRFRGRVIYPVFTLSGKVVAFGGRTLKNDKSMAKYVNSPESLIYSKKNELYGLYQAKGAIVKRNKCILVEGYMDVISMHQSGVENVVASSGTSLTPGQIRLIHRFTSNVTVIYDSDPAGIKASLRGIDMLLAEGLDIKVLLLPDGDDPDSFAQSHTSEEVEAYIVDNETDFIRFKTNILLKDCADDPMRRADAVSNIVQSIATIPSEIKRQIYIKECAISFGIDEAVLLRQVVKDMAVARERLARQQQRDAAVDSIANGPGVTDGGVADAEATPAGDAVTGDRGGDTATPVADRVPAFANGRHQSILEPQERALLSIVLKYGMLELGEEFCEGEEASERIRVIDFVPA
ncbi:MAG: DNA primase, partial [Muribaculaceae bacterium]|nr:DNA primase [Muribaculaceae bacterium]